MAKTYSTDGYLSTGRKSSAPTSQSILTPSLSDAARSNAWAKGCGKCSFGIVYAPPLRDIPHLSLFDQRLIQFRAGDIEFCDCAAGKGYATMLAAKDQDYKPLEEELAEIRRLNEERRQRRLFENAGIPPKYRELTFKSFLALAGGDPGKAAAIRAVRSYFDEGYVETKRGRKVGILLHGEPGVGKTGCLSPLFVHMVRDRQKSGLWVQYNELLASLRDFESGQVEERMRACQTVDYLFIDDFGDPAAQRSASDYSRDMMFRIIDYRNNHGLPMFVTSNLDLEKMTDQFDRRIVRRLADNCVFVRMAGAPLSDVEALDF